MNVMNEILKKEMFVDVNATSILVKRFHILKSKFRTADITSFYFITWGRREGEALENYTLNC